MLMVLALALAAAAPAAAQERGRPTIALTIYGGAQTGHGLWTVERQPLCVLDPGGGGSCTALYDTLRLARRVRRSLVAGVTATYFVLPHVGLHAQVGYEGFPLDDRCSMVHTEPDAEQRNEQLCDDIDRSTVSGGAIHLSASVVLRVAARAAVSPYLRAGVGIVSRPQSTVDVAGMYATGGGFATREVISDDSPHRTSLSGTVGIGLTAPLSPGYQLRLELRDGVSRIEGVAGAANALALAPTALQTFHGVALVVGLDIVLEQKRGRRY
jgi:opacity protein-like surface antigen